MADYVKIEKAGKKQTSLEMISFLLNSLTPSTFAFFRVCWINSAKNQLENNLIFDPQV